MRKKDTLDTFHPRHIHAPRLVPLLHTHPALIVKCSYPSCILSTWHTPSLIHPAFRIPPSSLQPQTRGRSNDSTEDDHASFAPAVKTASYRVDVWSWETHHISRKRGI